jgi:hypothetical protein
MDIIFICTDQMVLLYEPVPHCKHCDKKQINKCKANDNSLNEALVEYKNIL